MNKTEKLICLVLGAVLVWFLFTQKNEVRSTNGDAAVASTNVAGVVENKVAAVGEKAVEAAKPEVKAQAKPSRVLHSRELSISNDQEVVTFVANEDGVSIKKVTLLEYAKDCGEVSESNPPVSLDFAEGRGALALEGVVASADGKFDFRAESDKSIVYETASQKRIFELAGDYKIKVSDCFKVPAAAHAMSIGTMKIGDSKNDILSLDSQLAFGKKGKPEVEHHGDTEPLKEYLVAGATGGCSGSKSAAGLPETMNVSVSGQRNWVAVKNRFFVCAFAGSDCANGGFDTVIARNMASANYQPASATAAIRFADGITTRDSMVFIGPKKQSLLWDIGMKDVMEFGIWRWICYPLVWVLNVFNDWIPNYGVAIILLTILVRILFWPLTHKSTVGMKKMQEIQPLMKEIQAKFKDNPQRMQQETWALYKEHKVNPMSSCLPMLIQIPVFIALFNVLRSAVELRYAPFLWIADLSEPEGLFASWFPFGGLNILPIFMAATMALQSALTPSAGDKNQQKMMMVFMPVMMLFMFYSFPSALSLYWTLSQVISIVQMWMIRRKTEKAREVLTPEVTDPPVTRQMKRHGTV